MQLLKKTNFGIKYFRDDKSVLSECPSLLLGEPFFSFIQWSMPVNFCRGTNFKYSSHTLRYLAQCFLDVDGGTNTRMMTVPMNRTHMAGIGGFPGDLDEVMN